jgi:maltooligosyltrehalose trehalohydrolase
MIERQRCGAIPHLDGSVHWTVWAPKPDQIELLLLDSDRQRVLPMTPVGRGFYTHVESNVLHGQRYLYRIDGQHHRPDPVSRWQPEGVVGPSAVVRLEHFKWSDQNWIGIPREELVFYELHVGTFTPEGTFDAAIPRLPQLRELGVTAIELMPVGQFPGSRNWGYDGVLPFAVQDSYGGPDGLRRLIDACHAAGLAVIIDVVYNHFGPEGNFLGEFGPYFTDHYKTPWGQAVNFDGAGSDAVRDYVIANAVMWIEEYHADGLRLDACHAIYDFSPTHILSDIRAAVHATGERLKRRVHVIAESDMNDIRLLLPPNRGGYGLDAQWSDDFHHAVHAYLTGERQGYYADFGPANDLARVLEDPFLYDGRYSQHRYRKHGAPSGGLPGDRFVVCIQNHDQIGNRAAGDRFGTLLPPPKQRLAACLLLLAPYNPLIFMGEEYGEERPFPFFCSFSDPQLVENVRKGRRAEFAAFAWQGHVPDPQAEETFRSAMLAWSWPEGSRHAGLRQLYADLLAARREWPPMRDYVNRTSRLLPRDVLELTRGRNAELRAYFNLTDRHAEFPPGTVLLRSEAARYGGQREAGDTANKLFPYECVVTGPQDWRTFG